MESKADAPLEISVGGALDFECSWKCDLQGDRKVSVNGGAVRIFGPGGEEYFFMYPKAPLPIYTIVDGGSVLKVQKTLENATAGNGDSFSFMYHKSEEFVLPSSAKDPQMVIELSHPLIGAGKSAKPIKRGSK